MQAPSPARRAARELETELETELEHGAEVADTSHDRDRLASNATAEMHATALRLITAMAASINEKGYAATTIADIVRHARVSKRTFYEHFADKEACFLATYAAASAAAIETIVEAADPDLHWEEQIRAATKAHLAALESEPVLTRTFLLEIQAAGPRAIEMRREVHQRFAEVLCGFVERARARHPELRALTREMATAIVGGINELLLMAVEKRGAAHLLELGETAAELLRAVLLAPRPPARRKRSSGTAGRRGRRS